MRSHRLPSPAMIVATVSLIVALSGTGYAAVKLTRNSVGATQIRAGAVRSSEVKDRSLRARDFKTGELPRGATGLAGRPGTAGPAGPQGPAGPAGPATQATIANGAVGPDQLATLPAARAQTEGNYALANDTYAPLVLPTEVYDTASLHDGTDSTFTASRAGLYHVEGWVEFATGPTGEIRRMRVVAGLDTFGFEGRPALNGTRTQLDVSADVPLEAGQEVAVEVFQSDPGPLTITDGAASISYLGKLG
jgi:hypothetical protein